MVGSTSSAAWGFVRCTLSALLFMLAPPALATALLLAEGSVVSGLGHWLLAASMAAAAVLVAGDYAELGDDE